MCLSVNHISLFYNGSSLSKCGSNLCVNQHLPGGGGWAWSIRLYIEIFKDLDHSVCLSENGSSLCGNGSSLNV